MPKSSEVFELNSYFINKNRWGFNVEEHSITGDTQNKYSLNLQ